MRRTRAAWLAVLISNLALAADAPLSASELLHQFWNHDPKVAALADKPVRLSGLVAAKPGPRLTLQTDERGYFIRCTNEVANLPPPRALVVVEAKAPRERDSHIDVDECLVTWTEAQLFDRIPADVDVASHVARSDRLCRKSGPLGTSIWHEHWLDEYWGFEPATMTALASYFSSRKLEPIPCGNVALLILEDCRQRWWRDPWRSVPRIAEAGLVFEREPKGSSFSGTECAVPFIAEALGVAPMGPSSAQHD